MKPSLFRLPSLLAGLTLALAPACRATPALDGAGVVPFRSAQHQRPLLRYADGQLASLDHCAVKLENPLNPKIPPCYVNGRPVGFC